MYTTEERVILLLTFGSDGSMSASGSAGLGFDPQRGSKFSFENFQPRARSGADVHFLIARLYITVLD